MAIQNFICETCKCASVCDVRKVIAKFHEDASKRLPADIEVLNCANYLSLEK